MSPFARFISMVSIRKGTYTKAKYDSLKETLVQTIVQQAKDEGVDQIADLACLTSALHEGGTDPTEKSHVSAICVKEDETTKTLQVAVWKDRVTGNNTSTRHFYEDGVVPQANRFSFEGYRPMDTTELNNVGELRAADGKTVV